MMDSMSYEHPSVKRPLYSFAEADRIARVSSNTSRRWLKGYHFWYDEERREMPPLHLDVETKMQFLSLIWWKSLSLASCEKGNSASRGFVRSTPIAAFT